MKEVVAQQNIPSSLEILGVRVDAVDFHGAMRCIEQQMASGQMFQVATINPEFIVAAQADPEFRAILNRAALSVPDGVGVLWAARRQGIHLTERVGGVELLQRVAARAVETGWRLYLLGGKPGVAEIAARRLQKIYPGLTIAGAYAGSPEMREEADLVARIRLAQADILFVAYGAPQQEKWLARNLPSTGAKLGMGVGGAFDYLAGIRPRAPSWVQRLWIEWLYRLVTQPWRWRRMLALPRFVWLVLWEQNPGEMKKK